MTSYLRFDRWQNTAGTQYSNVIQTQFVSWQTVTTVSVTQSYQPLSGATITITSSYPNTKFLLMAHVNGYHPAQGGVNIGFNRVVGGVTTRLLGTDGGSGDSWMAEGNGGETNNSFNIPRHWLDVPGVAAGTSITYNVLGGNWNSSNGTAGFNWSGYTLTSMFTVMEIQP
jgi:hypothetical protein